MTAIFRDELGIFEVQGMEWGMGWSVDFDKQGAEFYKAELLEIHD